jgi:LL-diaminopimelate aminotransferase
MALINEDYLKLPENYLFTEIARKINIFKTMRPKARVIHLDVGDSNSILQGEVINTLHQSIDDLTGMGGVKGFDRESRHKGLITKILKNDFEPRGVKFSTEEVFLSDCSKNSAEEISEVISTDNIIGILDPTYPAYVYSTVMTGRAGERMEDGRWSNLIYIPCNRENGFVPQFPSEKLDIIYLSLPNNPTGTTLNFEELKKWVKYAARNQALIIYDAAHAIYIKEENVPHSIYEIKGAKKVAIEIRSFSKTTGYTGTNFSYTIIPKEVMGYTQTGEKISINKLWHRRHTSKFSGMPYLSLRAAEAMYTEEGLKEKKELINYYMDNANLIRNVLQVSGFEVQGGINSPYIWVKTPNDMNSWRFFEQLLYEVHVVCTPGVGFCPGGEGYVRFTGFCEKEEAVEAMERIKKWMA